MQQEPEIFFDDSQFKLSLFDDDWFEKNDTKSVPIPQVKTSILNTNDEKTKLGLGFSREKGGLNKKVNVAVVDRLQKGKKRKSLSDNTDNNSWNAHEIIEDVELSRTTIGKRNIKSAHNVQKLQHLSGNSNDQHGNDVSNIQDSKSNHINTTIISNPNSKTILNKELSNDDRIPSISHLSTKSNNTSEKTNNNFNLVTNESETSFKPKKKKRSKQKNIRKDSRPDELKPEHLRPGQGYCGRELTQETIRRLQEQGRHMGRDSARTNSESGASKTRKPNGAAGSRGGSRDAPSAAAVDSHVSWSLDYSKCSESEG